MAGFLCYTYDLSNNRKTMTMDGATTTYTYDRNNRLRNTVTVKSGTTKTTTYTYDGNGNCLTESGETSTQNTYNLLNQLTNSAVNGVTTQYAYRPDGLRASKLTGGIKTEHVWDGASIALDIAGTNYTKYVRGVNLISSALNSAASQYFLYNAHGDVVQLVNTSGSVVKSYDYDAFGVERNPVANDANPWRYCGEYFDKETGTIYLRARYYQPGTGRMLSEDPYWQIQRIYEYDPQGLNLYSYCMNNPVMFVDPWGLDSYILYDPNLNSNVQDYVKQMKADLVKQYGKEHVVHVIPIQAGKYKNDAGKVVQMTAKEYFVMKANHIGRNGNSVDTVIFDFHGTDKKLLFKDASGGWASQFLLDDMSKITNTREWDRLMLMSCNAATGDNNFAKSFHEKLNVNTVIGASGNFGFQYNNDNRKPYVPGSGYIKLGASSGILRVYYTQASDNATKYKTVRTKMFSTVGRLINAANNAIPKKDR